jgi:hypothetical protein
MLPAIEQKKKYQTDFFVSQTFTRLPLSVVRKMSLMPNATASGITFFMYMGSETKLISLF